MVDWSLWANGNGGNPRWPAAGTTQKQGGVSERLTASTSDATPVDVWPTSLTEPFPTQSTFRALIMASDRRLLANVDCKNLEVIGSMYVTFENNRVVLSTIVTEDSTAPFAAVTAAFVDNGGFPALRLTGLAGVDIDWAVWFDRLDV